MLNHLTTRRFALFAWAVLLFNILVIIWGAFVRVTGSGAGCGSDWPLCNGAVLPETPHHTTLIEFTHRITSGIALLMVVAQVVWSRRLFPRHSAIRRACIASLVFMITESLLGAGLVVFELVADSEASARAVWMPLHLVNTFLLLTPLSLCAWWASGRALMRVRPEPHTVVMFGGALVLLLLLGVTGAIAALGNLLFPAATLAEGLQQDLDPASHFLLRLRISHPLLAGLAAIYLALMVWHLHQRAATPAARVLSRVTLLLFVIEILVGIVNLVLRAPVALQLLHLLLAVLIWISLVLLTTEHLALRVSNRPARATQHWSTAYP